MRQEHSGANNLHLQRAAGMKVPNDRLTTVKYLLHVLQQWENKQSPSSQTKKNINVESFSGIFKYSSHKSKNTTIRYKLAKYTNITIIPITTRLPMAPSNRKSQSVCPINMLNNSKNNSQATRQVLPSLFVQSKRWKCSPKVIKYAFRVRSCVGYASHNYFLCSYSFFFFAFLIFNCAN
ncbi:unnamed protein product [Trypanosoma congolense IL3000]|uniref:WGS project CAEQ00000000 data, annotated contig 1972 n=1 Tax=Trypanosoma congolense (strain IL3000) TaxID=1068625 RepID=F9WAG5_TRYCI|nr:unnamed protein product [Trypanosoma congolense IL3000]